MCGGGAVLGPGGQGRARQRGTAGRRRGGPGRHERATGDGMSYQPVADSELAQQDPDRPQSLPSLICCRTLTALVFLLVIITFPITGWFVIKSVPRDERFVVFRLGKIIGSKGPGRILVLPFIDQWQKVDIRSQSFHVAPFKATCKDGAVILISVDVHNHIWNPVLSVMAVQDINGTAMSTAQDVMLNFLLKKKLATVQLNKTKTRNQLAFEINEKTKYWGLEVERVVFTLHRVLQLPEVILQVNESGTQIEENAAEEIESDCGINPDWVLSKVKMLLSEDLVKQIGACYLFHVNQKNGAQHTYYLDLTSVSEETIQALFSGDLKPIAAYMSGRIRLQGDMKLAMKLEDLIKKLQHL
uniref:stomatin-like protein 1 n=1 Tax=Pristiophorus japonicus TaxID=55135 RepID=UPI00398F47FB